MLTFKNNDELQRYLKENLLPSENARVITGQSTPAFNQSVAIGRLTPFYSTQTENGRIQNKLFLKSDLEHYKDNKRTR